MNFLMKTTVLAVSTLALTGIAQANVKAEWPSFNRVDSNRDGYIDEQEARAAQELNIKGADSDRDGKINRAEYSAAVHLNNNPEDSLSVPGSAPNASDSGRSGSDSGSMRNSPSDTGSTSGSRTQ